MKKTAIIILITLISFKFSAQETLYEVWPANSPELLIGKIVTPRPITETLQRYGYEDFYKLKKKKWVGYDDSRSKWEKEQGKVKYELILGRKFKVDTFEQYEDGLLSKKLYWLYMTDVETGQKVRHSYDPNYEHSFQLSMTEEMIYPEGWFCKDFEIEKDKFNGETRIRTPYGSTITFLKYINGDIETYYLQLRKNGSTLNSGEKGVFMILDNGDILEYPEEDINVEVSTRGRAWTYSAFMRMDQELIKKLMDNYITDFRLYIYDHSPTDGKQKMIQLNCLINNNGIE